MHVNTLIIFICIFNWFPTIELLTFKADGMSLSCLAIILSHLGCSPVRDRAPGPFLWDVGPNPREWVESCFLPLKMEVRLVIFNFFFIYKV